MISTGFLTAESPLDCEATYELVCIDTAAGTWLAKFCGEHLFEGPLEDAVRSANANLREAAKARTIRSLKESLYRLEGSAGGSWRRLKSANLIRERLQKLGASL